MSRDKVGRKLPEQVKRNVQTAYSVRDTLSHGELERQKKPQRKSRAIKHLRPFYDGNGVLREPNGRFAKNETPKHKRPLRRRSP